MVLDKLYFVLASVETTVHSAQVDPITHTTQSPIEFIYNSNIFNFVLVVLFIAWLVRKTNPFAAVVEKRNAIKKRIDLAEKDKINSENELGNTKKKIEKSDEEVQKITYEATGIADSLSNRIKKEAKLGADEIQKKAQRTIDIEKEVASGEVVQDISCVAFMVAEEHIKQAIDDRLHKKYIDEFIDNLENLKV